MNFIGQIIELVLGTFIVLLFVRLIVDWIQIFARSWVPRVRCWWSSRASTRTDPPVKALRKVIPPLRLGGVAIDLSFVALLLICYILLSAEPRHPARLGPDHPARPRRADRSARSAPVPLSCQPHSRRNSFDD